MIKLELPPKPVSFTDEIVKELTEKYKSDGSSVWNAQFIRDAVLAISNNKCCYSESKLNEEGKYMEIDHFHAKKYFPDKVVEWGNLLPANKKCNTTKGEHDVTNEPIVNPCHDDPKAHLYILNYRFYHRTPMGKTTIEVVALNDRQHFVNKRAEIGFKVVEILEDIYNYIQDPLLLQSQPKKRHAVRRFKELLQEATRENEYSATISTVILTEGYYAPIEKFFAENAMWDIELSDLKSELQFCSLIK